MKTDIRFLYYAGISWFILQRLFHKFLAPAIGDFSKFNFVGNPEDIIIKLLGNNIPETIKKEYVELQASL